MLSWTISNILSLVLSIASVAVCIYLIKKSLHNITPGQWSRQRLLRFCTSLFLLFSVLGYTAYGFCYALQPISESASYCSGIQILSVIGGCFYGLFSPASLIAAALTTVDRYVRLNILKNNDPQKKYIVGLIVSLVSTGLVSAITGVGYFLHPCLSISGTWEVIGGRYKKMFLSL